MSRYIDADDYEVQLKIDNHLNGYTDLARALHILRYQQPADVRENVKGEWQVREEIENNCYIVRCSNCHAKVRVGGNVLYDSKIELNNFCPNCGADMRGANDD